VAEKSLLWLRFDVVGKSVHGSTPHKGVNALRASARFMTDLMDVLERRFPEEDSMFNPPFSTFEPTKCSSTVDNVNTIPGAHSFCMDMRLLPSVDIDAVVKVAEETAKRHSLAGGASITVTEIQRNLSGRPSSTSSKGFDALLKAVEKVTGTSPVASGTGAATCANFFRLAGLDAYGWQFGGGTLHGPNEYVTLENLMTDCKVFTALYYELCLKG
jgi:succinyl-diaminopimelate desuccinylase